MIFALMFYRYAAREKLQAILRLIFDRSAVKAGTSSYVENKEKLAQAKLQFQNANLFQMKNTIISILRILFGFFFIVVGLDKFFLFLDDCTIYALLPDWFLYAFGVTQIVAGICIILRKCTIPALLVSVGLLTSAIIIHLCFNTYDIGGAIFLLVIAIGLFFVEKRTAKSA